ncbi:sel1 repeat family protein [Luteimonas yindakuii]|uniref:sel1 repeat family protein n=1 Tax=Luteimonas yindakuii TaxID=2565782 RepID=UPI0010A33C43|nr:sel1 repeat family protein [Luteimonas yindakuii]QCO68603.1 sel1 repeat family protein [Luteimonas yindakuii]
MIAIAGSVIATGATAGERLSWADRTPDYWNAHPDQKHRMLGLAALQEGRAEEARGHFERAAHHADKASQALMAQLLWEGRGVAQDRALAYAWMDLAAERGDPRLAAQRELYWSGLEEASRQRALAEGKSIYDRYADDVAQPRLERERRRWTQIAVGSRLGSPGAARVCTSRNGGGRPAGAGMGGLDFCQNGLDSAVHYADSTLSPAQYWRARDLDAARLFGADLSQVKPPQR